MKETIINAILTIVLLLTTYFFLMVALGLEHNFSLRILNAVFMLGGLYWAIRKVGFEHGDNFNYFSGASTGVIISIGVGILFSTIIGIYLALNPAFMMEIKATEPQGEYLNPVGLSLLIFIEALASGILFTYGSLQYLKSSRLENIHS